MCSVDTLRRGFSYAAVSAVAVLLLAVTSLGSTPVSAASATITVNSTADNTTADAVLTLREAMLVANGDWAVTLLTAGECAQVSNSTFSGTCSTTDTIGAGSGDFIRFSNGTFPVGTPATITLASTLPTLSTGGDEISGIFAGVIIAGVSMSFDCFVISGEASDANSIKMLEIRLCLDAVEVSGGADSNVIGGANAPEVGSNCNTTGDEDSDGYPNDGCPASGAPEGNRCDAALDEDGDTLVNDGCPQIGAAAESACADSVDNDGDGVVNDGCPALTLAEAGSNCRDSVDDDADALVNDGCLARGSGNVIYTNNIGIRVTTSTTQLNSVQGNLIGTEFDGRFDNGNLNGVHVDTSNTFVGTSAASERNVISGNDQNGVNVSGAAASGIEIIGNYIGTDASGTIDLGNTLSGVVLSLATSNKVGGVAVGERNVISGNNTMGVFITGETADSNLVRNNYIGVNVDGTSALANSVHGVAIGSGADNNDIGGDSSSYRNVISGNGDSGVQITNTGTTGNLVRGNYIGTNYGGTAAIANASRGVQISGSATGNTVGGSTAGERNIISGNTSDGVRIGDSGTTGNTVKGNYIGTDAAGTAAIPNAIGIQISDSAASNTVGGETAGERNVISGNSNRGVLINVGTTLNVVKGNYIGTSASGAAAVPNAISGVFVLRSTNNTIGGTTAGARNVISGNANGVLIQYIESTGNIVAGNYIGTDATGTAALANTGFGVDINGSNGNTIGGTAAGAGNVLSGNSNGPVYGHGITIESSTTGNTVQGNLIGTNAAGTASIPNSGRGILLNGADGNTIGGTTAAARNIISGNTGAGIDMGNGANSNVIRGNFIGSDITGTADLGNGGFGIGTGITDDGNTIGGTAAGEGNVISGNNSGGISIGSTGNVIQGNFIGTQMDGVSALGNSFRGITISSVASNTVGGTTAGAGNIIAYNGSDGVRVTGAAATANTIRRNSIHSNGLLGIDNSSGGNTELAPPVITALTPSTSTVSGTTCSGCTVEVFSDAVDEGFAFRGVATTISTSWSFTGTLGGAQLTATATDASGNTSEFSLPVPWVALGAKAGDPAPGGGTFDPAFDLGVANNGQAVFHNTVSGGTSQGIYAFFGGAPGSLPSAPVAVAVPATQVPDLTGANFLTFGPPVNISQGPTSSTIVFHATLGGGPPNEGLFAFFAGSATPNETLAVQNGAAQGGGTFLSFFNPSVNNTNGVAAKATLTGSGLQGLYAFFAGSPDVDQRLAIQGGGAQGGGQYSNFSDPSINDQVYVAARATLTGVPAGTEQRLFKFHPSSTELLAVGGQTAAPGTPGANDTFSNFFNPAINNEGGSGRVAVRATTTDPVASEGVFAFFGGSPTMLALKGQVAPDTGGLTYLSFGDPIVDDLGVVVVKATLSDFSDGIFAFFAGSPSGQILLQGDRAAEGGTYSEFLYIAFNDSNEIVFIADRDGAGQGVFFASLDLDYDNRIDVLDNCPTMTNTNQANHDGDAQGDPCDADDDNDTICDPNTSGAGCTGSDNCYLIANTNQANFDADTQGDVCDADDDNDLIIDTTDTDDDNDRVADVAEGPCGGTTPSLLRPERLDGVFATADDDGDTLTDEALPGGSENSDCDGDGYRGDGPGAGNTSEKRMYMAAGTANDQDPCGGSGWPADLVTTGPSLNRINLTDVSSFISGSPRKFGTDPGDPGYDVRWDLVTGNGAAPPKDISLTDLTNITTLLPPMLFGVKAFSGPVCPWPP